MHGITLKVTNDPAIQVDLVQVPTAVVEVIDIALIGEGERLQVAQLVVAILQQPGAVSFAQQLSYGVVGVFKLLFFTLIIRENDGQQVVGGVVAVVGNAILGALAQQAADGITFEVVADRRCSSCWGVLGQRRLFKGRGHVGEGGDPIQHVVFINATTAIQVFLRD
ncbi:hypothetical protein D3C79_813020 [compost metagenome]